MFWSTKRKSDPINTKPSKYTILMTKIKIFYTIYKLHKCIKELGLQEMTGCQILQYKISGLFIEWMYMS